MFKKGDKVRYNDKEYTIVFIYEGTGLCEINASGFEHHLVHPNELVKVEKKETKNT